MSFQKTLTSWAVRLRQWLDRWLAGHGVRPPAAQKPLVGLYPDYVTCPHCGELEVEVWSHERTARCHNCGQTFDHLLPPGSGPGPAPPTEGRN